MKRRSFDVGRGSECVEGKTDSLYQLRRDDSQEKDQKDEEEKLI
jgi:hypothetical protein